MEANAKLIILASIIVCSTLVFVLMATFRTNPLIAKSKVVYAYLEAQHVKGFEDFNYGEFCYEGGQGYRAFGESGVSRAKECRRFVKILMQDPKTRKKFPNAIALDWQDTVLLKRLYEESQAKQAQFEA